MLRNEPVEFRGLTRSIADTAISGKPLRLQARDLWVFNRNELKKKELVDG